MTGIIVTCQFLLTFMLCCKESVFEDQGLDCNTVIYKKYIFGHLNDQNKLLIEYIWSLSTILGSQFPEFLEFPKA